MSVHVVGLGTAAPELSISQGDSLEHALGVSTASVASRNLAERVYAHSGVDYRHSVLLEESAGDTPPRATFYRRASVEHPQGPTTAERMEAYAPAAAGLARRASLAALLDAEFESAEVTHLVTVSCSGFQAPGVDITLIDTLGLRPDVARTNVGFMGCHGALNGLRVAKAFCDADPLAVVLLVAVELCSLHYQYDWSPERIVANALFADGAAAAVLASGAGAEGTRAVDHFSTIFPHSADAMSWKIGDHGFVMTLSARVPELIARECAGPLGGWLDRHGLALGDVGSWCVHPGGPRVLDACAEGLGLDERALVASRDVLRRYGNMSSPTVLFVLEELRRSRAAGPTVLLGFGPGLALEAALLG